MQELLINQKDSNRRPIRIKKVLINTNIKQSFINYTLLMQWSRNPLSDVRHHLNSSWIHSQIIAKSTLLGVDPII